MSSPSLSLHGDQYNSWRWVPLLTPALEEDSCMVDLGLVLKRVAAVAITIFASIPVLSIAFPVGIRVFSFISMCLLSSLAVDFWLTNQASIAKAVNEYLKMPYPSKSATFIIQDNFTAAQLLIDKNGDVNKVDEEGSRLLDYVPDIDIFKFLTSHGADLKALDKQGVSYFQRTVENENPAYLEYILKNHLAKPEDFDSTQQIKFWTNLGSIKAAHLLKQYGFDVNVRDNKGYTPLLRAVKDFAQGSYLYFGRKLGIAAQVSALLTCGADRSVTVLVKGELRNAMQLNKDPSVRNILEQA